MWKNFFKRTVLFFSPVLILLIHLPFVSAVIKPVDILLTHNTSEIAINSANNNVAIVPYTAATLYDTLKLNKFGLSQQAFVNGINGFNYLVSTGKIINRNIISIADFSLPSSQKRFFVFDINSKKILFNTYIAHGINSGREYARSFSNKNESNQSSLGFYQTKGTYNGNNGYSLKLQGLEYGFNDNAESRAIVMHGAAYVSESFIQAQGYIGRSQGCPALPEKVTRPIIDKIKNGTCFFIYSPDKNYQKKSKILNA